MNACREHPAPLLLSLAFFYTHLFYRKTDNLSLTGAGPLIEGNGATYNRGTLSALSINPVSGVKCICSNYTLLWIICFNHNVNDTILFCGDIHL